MDLSANALSPTLAGPGRAGPASSMMMFDDINDTRYYFMILSFRSADTQALFAGQRVARFANFEMVAMRKLQQLHAAVALDFLRLPPGNRLEALSGDRPGQHSIRINEQWRLCFEWRDGHAHHGEIVDYH